MGETMKRAVENNAEAHRQVEQAQSHGRSLFKDFCLMLVPALLQG